MKFIIKKVIYVWNANFGGVGKIIILVIVWIFIFIFKSLKSMLDALIDKRFLIIIFSRISMTCLMFLLWNYLCDRRVALSMRLYMIAFFWCRGWFDEKHNILSKVVGFWYQLNMSLPWFLIIVTSRKFKLLLFSISWVNLSLSW